MNFNDSSFQTGNRENTKYSGSYKGIFFFEDDGANEMKEVFPIILINDTCSYLYFEEVLFQNFSIEENLVSFNKIGDYFNTMYIGEGRIEDDGIYGKVVFKKSDNIEKSAEGMIQKVSEISENDIAIINNAIIKENEFEEFWSKFNEALRNNDVVQLCNYVNFPFNDRYGSHWKVYNYCNASSGNGISELLYL